MCVCERERERGVCGVCVCMWGGGGSRSEEMDQMLYSGDKHDIIITKTAVIESCIHFCYICIYVLKETYMFSFYFIHWRNKVTTSNDQTIILVTLVHTRLA